MMTVGYSSYAVILIRSAANTPMDQQSPEDPFTLKDYLGREQYGDTPLLYGPTFASPRALKEKTDTSATTTRKQSRNTGGKTGLLTVPGTNM